MRNGAIRIKGKNVVVEATEDLDMKAGRNINLNAGSGRILMNCNKADIEGLTGTLIEKLTGTFGMKVFQGSFVGADLINLLIFHHSILLPLQTWLWRPTKYPGHQCSH